MTNSPTSVNNFICLEYSVFETFLKALFVFLVPQESIVKIAPLLAKIE